jgi:hypothetical protein
LDQFPRQTVGVLTDAHLKALGRVAVAAGGLELLVFHVGVLLTRAIGPAALTEPELAKLSVGEQVVQLRALAPSRLDVKTAERASQLFLDIELTLPHRNRLLHSAWLSGYDHAVNEPDLIRRRLLARKGTVEIEHKVSVEAIEEIAGRLLSLQARSNVLLIEVEKNLAERVRRSREEPSMSERLQAVLRGEQVPNPDCE